MGVLLITVAVILIASLLIKPLIYVLAAFIFIFKTFGKALLFYAACIACFYFTRKLGIASMFPPVTGGQMFWCVVFAFFTPIYFSVKKSKKADK